MTLNLFLLTARRKLAWLAITVALFAFLAIYFYATSSDYYVTEAIVTAKTSEDRGFDAGSLSGLAALAGGGGQRPTFEQLGFLMQSTSVIQQALPALERSSPKMVNALLGRSPMQKFRLGLEQSARAMFGKPPVLNDDMERITDAIRGSVKIAKTPEGFLRVSFTNGIAEGQVALIRSLLGAADNLIRAREKIDYITRVNAYRVLIDQQTRPTEREILISLISREYSTYVSAQSGTTFSYEYIDPPLIPHRMYAKSLLVVMVLALFLAVLAYLTAVWIYLWRAER
ncbi:MAG: hypothetical protein ACRYG4_16810 [Janthinobacterium lividum]